MEESEKRRERLKALKMEATQANLSGDVETSSPSHLSNPLMETSATMLEQPEPSAARRFDFYTDPMAAFSTNKKRGKFGSHTISDNYVSSACNNSPVNSVSPNFPGLRNPGLSPSPAHQFQHSPNQQMFYARGFSGPGAHGSPIATVRPFPMDQGTPNIWSGPRSPSVQGTPNIWSGHRSPSGNFPSHLGRGMNSHTFSPEPRGNIYTNAMQDRVNYRSPTPGSGYRGSPNPGRGGYGRSGNMTPGSRWGSGRGSGSHGRHFSVDRSPRPEQFYDESMLEDPWKFLQPVIWRINTFSKYSANPLSKSGGTKKARASESSGPSLAEYLAASFNDAVDNAPGM